MFGATGLPSSIILSEAPSQTHPMVCPLERILNPAKVMTQVNCPPGEILFLTKPCGAPVTLRPGGQMAAVLRGQASLAHTVQNPLPEQPACSVRLEFIRQHMVQVLQRDLIFLVFLPASLQPSPLREMNLVTAHLCLPLASRVVNELSVCSADDRLGAWPCAVRRARLGTAEEDERVLVEFSPREATADVPGRCNMTPKGRGGDFWMSLLGLQLPQRGHMLVGFPQGRQELQRTCMWSQGPSHVRVPKPSG